MIGGPVPPLCLWPMAGGVEAEALAAGPGGGRPTEAGGHQKLTLGIPGVVAGVSPRIYDGRGGKERTAGGGPPYEGSVPAYFGGQPRATQVLPPSGRSRQTIRVRELIEENSTSAEGTIRRRKAPVFCFNF